ncbi:MAG: hypothetical protein M1817_004118 [Caeruleum heppii]|nr:MAG: hypothetical protein M1817_004118 [Caeruleum heppii]
MKLPSTHYQASHALPKSNRVVEPTSVPVGVRKSPPGFAQAYSRSPPSASSPVQLHLATSKQERSVQQGQPLPDGHIRARRGSEERRPGTSDSSSKSYVPESPMDPAMKGGDTKRTSASSAPEEPHDHPFRVSAKESSEPFDIIPSKIARIRSTPSSTSGKASGSASGSATAATYGCLEREMQGLR